MIRKSRLRRMGAAALALAGAVSAVLAGAGGASIVLIPLYTTSPAAQAPLARTAVPIHRRLLLGRSVEGRPIVAVETGNRSSAEKVLVVGCIHGNECAGTAVARRLIAFPPPTWADLWIIPNLNPDGAAHGSRGNAHEVDLNRNFPWHWQRLSGIYYSGPHALSEPESRIAYRFILRLHPTLSIWFHQHLGLVDESGGNVAIERRFAALVGFPVSRLARKPGSVTTWENHTQRGTGFVVELHAGSLRPATAARFARAVLAISRQPA